ncbi:ABC transporter permease [Amygdalobacter nucleatus]|uniref:Putative spermidine/putrescine ABC transporter, permease protein PotB n=1 Tax=Amygdalobacter nucleatus TaxID=3029274 RepID=A0A133YCJ7_9FIRM|nr:ABC transporter permease [Amygdalobacter nucleatus]KXB40924.1 putative spermidine/putrescine ABC transporter, permease protein PotB [Amygdalobacter nucleatus]MDF0485369.1 ABC transporter permease [Amygdalobacter nucleatus]WEG36768.1 ABC transporter permease [Amygdalobacter nucleatus]
MDKFRRFAYPYKLWLFAFIISPLLAIFYFAFTNDVQVFSLANFTKFLQAANLKPLFNSIKCSFICTLICLLLGYPLAYIMAKLPLKYKTTVTLLIIIPMWMNFLLRTYAWVTLLSRNGILNALLSYLGLARVDLLYTETAIILGMVYNFLPFMVLPIYTILSEIQQSYIEAASDLGASPKQVFQRVILPLSWPGIVSGISMVFIPAISTFEITALLGGNKTNLIGNMIEQQFTVIGNWHYGSAIALILMLFILISLIFDQEEGA